MYNIWMDTPALMIIDLSDGLVLFRKLCITKVRQIHKISIPQRVPKCLLCQLTLEITVNSLFC